MTNKFKLPRTDVPTIDSGRTITCTLTGESFSYRRHDPTSRRKAIEAAQDAGAVVIDANNQRAGRKLSIKEHQAMLAGKFSEDQRSIMERILSDGIIKDNADKSEDDVNGIASATAADLQNDKLWNKTKSRRIARERLRTQFQKQFEERQQQLKEQAEREQREADPHWKNACEHAEVSLKLVRGNPASLEADLLAFNTRLDALRDGRLSVEGYWQEVEKAESKKEQS